MDEALVVERVRRLIDRDTSLTEIGDQHVDDPLVREVVAVVHHLLHLVHVAVDLGAPVDEQADLARIVLADDVAVGRDDPRVVVGNVREERAVFHVDGALVGAADRIATVEHELVLHHDAAIPDGRAEDLRGAQRSVRPVGEGAGFTSGTTT